VSATIPDPAATDWVPLWDLGRQPVKYLGTYNAGTTYNDGDVVIGPDGLAYICVMDGTIGTAPGWGGSFPPLGASYGTSLPSSPIDGQEAVLVDSTTNPSYQWRFRYNAGSTSAYKWELVGGTTITVVTPAADSTTTTGAWVDLSTVAPRFVLPRAGDYTATGGCAFNHNTAANAYGQVAICRNATNPSATATAGAALAPVAGYGMTIACGATAPGCAAGDDLRLRYQASTAGTTNFHNRWLTVQPVRVS
jgi:hypothetical protein